MQALQPLRIVDIALSSGHHTRLAGVGHNHVDAAVAKHFIHRHPIDARGLHRHSLDAYRDKPVRHLLNAAGEPLKGTYRRPAQLEPNRDNMKPRPDIDDCCAIVKNG